MLRLAVKATLAFALAALTACAPSREFSLSRNAPVVPARPGGLLDTVGACIAATVQVYALDKDGLGISRGSGVVVGKTTVLTARHMVEGEAVSFRVLQGKESSEAICARRGEGALDDWAVLLLVKPLGAPASLVSHGGLGAVPLQEAVAVGYALGLPVPTVTVGHIQSSGDLIRMSSPIIFGNSGGGLFVIEDGRLCLAGITVAVYTSGSSPICHMGISVSVGAIRSQGGIR